MKTKIVFIIFLCIRISLFSQKSVCSLVIKGRLIDSSLTYPLEQAVIEVIGYKNKHTSTDIKGEFEIRELCPGLIELHISHYQCEHTDLKLRLFGDTQITIFMKHSEQEFEGAKLTVKSLKSEHIHITGPKQLESRKGSSIATMMQDIGGVSLLKTGSNVSKPIVNGLHSNRVIIIHNGLRQEGQNWGMEHAPEIDAFLANEIELIKGAESLRYASDGIGGIVMVKPISIFKEKTGFLKGELNVLYTGNGRTGIVSGFAGNKISDKFPLYWRIQGTLKQGGNTHAPGYYMGNTGIKERNYSFHLAYALKSLKTELFYSRFENRIGIFSGSHIGNLTDLQKAIDSDRPLISSGFSYTINRPYQLVNHQVLKLRNEILLNRKNNIEFVISYQNNHRQEYDILRTSNAFKGPSFDYDLNTYMGDLSLVHTDFHKLNFKTGIYGIRQSNDYSGRFFIPAFYQKGLASYFTAVLNKRQTIYEAGFRYDVKQLKSYLWNNNTLNIKTSNFNNFTYHLQAGRQFDKASGLTIIHSSAWRPPAPNELYANGLHQGLASLEIGDSSLQPERSYNQSLSYCFQKKKFYLEAEMYYKYIKGFINLVPSLIPQLTIRGAFPVFRYEQNNAELYGLNILMKRDFANHLFVRTSANILFGNNLSLHLPLNQMPPLSGKTNMGYENKKISIQAFVIYVASQFRYSIHTDYKAPPKGYYLLGLEASYHFKIRRQVLKFSISMNNLTNNRYREYLNRFRYFTDEQGFNLTARLIVPLNIQFKQIKPHEH